MPMLTLVALMTLMTFGVMAPATSASEGLDVVWLDADDFIYGTYIIDRPGTYKLAEDISFNPNSPATLTAALETGAIPADVAAQVGLPDPVDAYHAGRPLYTQFAHGDDAGPFAPGGPLDARYDPAAYGVGFFAAIAVAADGVVIDLDGHTIEQSAEHALLQRFFSVIELADQPFIPDQGPAGFGDQITSATNVEIRNGIIGRSSHHGIHGNGNENVTISHVDFVDYEVGAVALNGVQSLSVRHSVAENRKGIPVLGTFSAATFIKAYIDDLVEARSTTTLTVGGQQLRAVDIQGSLQAAINNTHHDVIVDPNIVNGRAVINEAAHPVEYGLFHNSSGFIDGNSYSFLTNEFGVAVNGFPTTPDGIDRIPSRNVRFRNVHVIDQRSSIKEVPAIDSNGVAEGGAAVIDPVGAVFQVRNTHPRTGAPITIASLDDTEARYVGNPLANAQGFLAKAVHSDDLGNDRLDITRLNIPGSVVGWVEGRAGSETLADIGTTYLCNGDSMFHVNKGAIAFKLDAVEHAMLVDTSVHGLENIGPPGDGLCGDYSDSTSHPAATINGYGGAAVRAYTFAGAEDVIVVRSEAGDLRSKSGPAAGFAMLTDSTRVSLVDARVRSVDAGWDDEMPGGGPNNEAHASGFYVADDTGTVTIIRACVTDLDGYDGEYVVHDLSGHAMVIGTRDALRGTTSWARWAG